ncbi:MAG: hypothetical protein GY799_12325 [Desulfobulbaceae bacterium]|nr:hypothetical protein [Desulfobulbaceae bacterium]
MSTELNEKGPFKRVPDRIIINGKEMDKGKFEISFRSTLRELDSSGNETGHYMVDPERQIVVGDITAVPVDRQQIFMDTIGQMIDHAYNHGPTLG